MDLWIRSQNKEILVKTDKIKIEREYIDFKDKEIFHINIAYDELGKYSTKERALEILDEIDKLMSDAVNNGLKVARYKMPKE